MKKVLLLLFLISMISRNCSYNISLMSSFNPLEINLEEELKQGKQLLEELILDKKKLKNDYFLNGDITMKNGVVLDLIRKIHELNENYIETYDDIMNRYKPKREPLLIHITSNGGELNTGLLLYDLIKHSKYPINTLVEGYAFSAGSLIFCAGKQRYMFENSFLLVHNLHLDSFKGVVSYDEIKNIHKNNKKMTKRTRKIYSKCSFLTEKEIKNLMRKDEVLTSYESIEYGFAHSIYRF